MELRAGKRFWSKAERLQMVEESLQPGASASRVARAHDINSNQLFYWRKQYREGYFSDVSSTALVPVEISSNAITNTRRVAKAVTATSGTIEIEIGEARVRIEGAADPACVRAAIEGLRR